MIQVCQLGGWAVVHGGAWAGGVRLPWREILPRSCCLRGRLPCEGWLLPGSIAALLRVADCLWQCGDPELRSAAAIAHEVLPHNAGPVTSVGLCQPKGVVMRCWGGQE